MLHQLLQNTGSPLRASTMLSCLLLSIGFAITSTTYAEDKPAAPQLFKYQITGMFSPDREQDLKELFAKLPKFKLVKVDYETAEASVEYDPAQVFPKAKPEDFVQGFDQTLREASRQTFGAKPLCSMPLEKLKRIEIPVVGLDCKACSYAAYEMIYKLPGVERATASFKLGMITALIDPEKTNREELETALKKGQVQIKTQE